MSNVIVPAVSRMRLRARTLLSDGLATVAVALVVVAAVGGWLTYDAVASPPTETETVVVSSWSTTGAFDHRATVVEDNSLYEVGTTLPNRPVYFRDVSPTVAVTFRYGFDASTGGNLSATVRSRLVVSEVRESADGETVLWRTSRDLGRWRGTELEPGDEATFPVAVNATRVARRTTAIQEDLGAGLGTTRTRLVFDVAIEGRVGGRKVTNETRYVLPLSIDRSTVVVEDPGPATARRERTRQVVVTRRPGAARVGATALLSLGSGLALAGLVVARRRDALAPSPARRAVAEHDRARREFDEWITAGRLPEAVRSWPRVEVESLSGLVDTAIDTDARVIEDDGEYVVPARGLVYAYVPPETGDEASREADDATAGGDDAADEADGTSAAGDAATGDGAADRDEAGPEDGPGPDDARAATPGGGAGDESPDPP